jgi:hypothetical protein
MADNFFTSPDVRNYRIATGIASFKPDGDTTYRDLGACSAFNMTLSITKKDHKIARGGAVKTDFSVVTDVSGTFKVTLDEITPENVALFTLSDPVTNTDGSVSMEMLDSPNKSGHLKIVGDNATGPQNTIEGYVTLGPSGDFSQIDIAGDLSTLPFEGTMSADPVTGKFPIVTFPATKI